MNALNGSSPCNRIIWTAPTRWLLGARGAMISQPRSGASCTRAVATKTAPPHPHWKPKETMGTPFQAAKMRTIDPATAKPRDIYPLLISTIVPRPIALLSTTSAEGVGNVAPFSYFNMISHDPPLVIVSINTRRDGTKKDSLRNIEATKEFVVNIISEWFIEAAHYTTGEFPFGVNEMNESGLTAVPSTVVRPARVGESAVHLECTLHQLLEFKNDAGKSTTTAAIGRVRMLHVQESVLTNGLADVEKLQPIARLGGDTYGRVNSTFDIPRPKVKR